MNLNRNQNAHSRKPFWGKWRDLQKGLQCIVICEPTQRRRSKHLHHTLYLPPPPVFFFFFSPKNRYFCRPVLIRASTCFVLARGASVLISTTLQRARSFIPVHLSAFGISCLGHRNLPGARGQNPGTESGEKLIRPLYPCPGE